MEYKGKYSRGWKPVPDTYWMCEAISKDGISLEYLGVIKVSGKEVSREMDEHQSIKDYMPYKIAKRVAKEHFPQVNPIIVTQIGRDVYDRKNRKP